MARLFAIGVVEQRDEDVRCLGEISTLMKVQVGIIEQIGMPFPYCNKLGTDVLVCLKRRALKWWDEVRVVAQRNTVTGEPRPICTANSDEIGVSETIRNGRACEGSVVREMEYNVTGLDKPHVRIDVRPILRSQR